MQNSLLCDTPQKIFPPLKLSELAKAKYTINGREWPYVDCWGFVEHALQFNKLSVNYKNRKDFTKNLTQLWLSKQIEETTSPQLYDLFGQFRNSDLYHVGICLSSNKLLHLSKSGLQITTPEKLLRNQATALKYFRIIF